MDILEHEMSFYIVFFDRDGGGEQNNWIWYHRFVKGFRSKMMKTRLRPRENEGGVHQGSQQ